jgi:hypothetical protein
LDAPRDGNQLCQANWEVATEICLELGTFNYTSDVHTCSLPVKPQSWLSQLSTRSRRTVRQDSILRNSRQTSQLRCMSLRPTSQISRALYDRSNSFLLVRYAAIKPNTHIPFGRQPALRATISVTISQFNLTRTLAQLSPTNIPISSSRSKLATARKPS